MATSLQCLVVGTVSNCGFLIAALVTTIGYQLKDKPAVYALEGSVAIAGAAITWLRDNLELITTYKEVEEMARSVKDSSGVFFVPAFQGLFDN